MKARRAGPTGWAQLDPADWPSGDTRPIAVLQLEPEDLERKYGLEFREDRDDLDSLRMAVVQLDSGTVVGLLRYSNGPTAGTGLYAEGSADPDTVVKEILR